MSLTATQNIGTYSFPTRVVFGPGVVDQLGTIAKQLGMKRPLIATDPGMVQSGLLDRIIEPLTRAGLTFCVFDGVEGNPTEASVFPGVEIYEEQGADGVIALGGGSAVDAGKAIRLAITHKRPLEEYDDLIGGDAHITSNMPPMIAVATTSGTGSEVSRSTVIGLRSTGRKTVIFSPHLIPTVAVADPQLTIGLPPHLTAWTGADALTHNVEAYLAKGFHPFCDALALQGTRYCGLYLRRAVKDGADLEARTWMMMASMMGALAFQKGLGATHSLAHPLSSVAGVHHGHANAIMLPHVLKFNADVVSDRLVDLARVLDAEPTPQGAIDAIQSILDDIGVTRSLTRAGVKAEMVPLMVPLAQQDGCHQLNPRACSEKDFEAMYLAALEN